MTARPTGPLQTVTGSLETVLTVLDRAETAVAEATAATVAALDLLSRGDLPDRDPAADADLLTETRQCLDRLTHQVTVAQAIAEQAHAAARYADSQFT